MTKKTRTATSESKARLEEFKWPCMVCGRPSEPCVPLTICDRCKDSPKAEIVRQKHKAWFWKERAENYSDELDAVEIYAASLDDKLQEVKAKVEHQRNITTEIDGQGYMNALNWFIELLSDSDKAEATA